MGEWVRVAKERARTWCVLEKELAEEKNGVRNMVVGWRERSKLKQKQKRRRGMMGKTTKRKLAHRGEDGDGESEDDQDEDDGAEEEEEQDGKKIPEAELVPYMSRTTVDYDIPLLLGNEAAGPGPGGSGSGSGSGGGDEKSSSSLRVQWKIEFDWTGEARSDIRCFVAVPGKCEFLFFFPSFFSPLPFSFSSTFPFALTHPHLCIDVSC